VAKTPEAIVKEAVHKYLHKIGCIRAGTKQSKWPETVRGWYYMPVKGVAMGVNGIPDFIGFHDGRFFAIETKAPGKRNDTSANQKARLAEIRKANGLAIVVVNGNHIYVRI
jgi:hypothetical protein